MYAAGILFLLLLAWALHRGPVLSAEAAVYDAITRQLLNNTMAGRQALAGSLWWPPLPVLLRVPCMLLPGAGAWSSILVSCAAAAGIALLFWRSLSRWGLRRAWPVWLAAALALPFFGAAAADGSRRTIVMLLVLWCGGSLLDWTQTRRMRALVYLALALAGLAGVDAALWPWTMLVLILAIADLLLRAEPRARKEGAAIVLVMPWLYGFGVWLLVNWLIMGDPLYFLRSLPLLTAGNDATLLPDPPAHAIAAAVMMTGGFLLAVLDRRRGELLLNAAGIILLLTMLWLNGFGRGLPLQAGWDAAAMLAILAMAHIAAREAETQKTGLRSIAAALAVTALLLITWRDPAGRQDFFHGPQQDLNNGRLVLHTIERHVRARSQYPAVMLCGYEALPLIAARGTPDMFVPWIDPDLARFAVDYHGHNLYLLIPHPENTAQFESIHWKYPGLFNYGTTGTLYEGDWHGWRLYEWLQPRR